MSLISSAFFPEKEEEAAMEDLRHYAKDAEHRNLLQTYGDDLLVVPNDILLTVTQGVYLKALKDGAASGKFE